MDNIKNYIPYELHLMVDMIGEEKFLEICKMYGGSSVYIPVHHRALQGRRDAAIVKEYNGKNISLLRAKFDLSEKRIKEILKLNNVL